jgi:hypothetical protein
MKNTRIAPIDFNMILKISLRWVVTLFVTCLPFQSWSSSSCLLVVSNEATITDPKKMSLEQIWQKIISKNKASDGTMIPQPDPKQMLFLSYVLSKRIIEKLATEGYTSELYEFKSRSDLNNSVPARWGVKIIQAPETTWMGRVVNKSIQNTHVKFLFDPYGLYRNSSEGTADYTGITEISFGIHHLQTLNSDFIDSLLHEIHHASNHRRLKAQDPSGIYAEIHSLYKDENWPQHKFSGLYPYYFHLDELPAYSKEIFQTRRKLLQAKPGSEEFTRLKQRLSSYLEIYNTLYSEAVQVLDLAASTFMTESGQKGTEFFNDKLHRNASAQIRIKKPGENLSTFKFTIWTPGMTTLDHDDKSYRAVYNEILALQEKILKLGPIHIDVPH